MYILRGIQTINGIGAPRVEISDLGRHLGKHTYHKSLGEAKKNENKVDNVASQPGTADRYRPQEQVIVLLNVLLVVQGLPSLFFLPCQCDVYGLITSMALELLFFEVMVLSIGQYPNRNFGSFVNALQRNH